MSAITENALVQREEENDAHYEPVIKLTEQVETKTLEEDEDVLFKMRSKLFRFSTESNEWKERGTGDVRLLQHKESKVIRLVMRRDKTLKVCANHLISHEMRLQPNVGSDRSWVWKVAADYSENPPTSETLAIRFANSENAEQFKTAFQLAQDSNAALIGDTDAPPPIPVLSEKEPTSDTKEDAKEEVNKKEETEKETKEE